MMTAGRASDVDRAKNPGGQAPSPTPPPAYGTFQPAMLPQPTAPPLPYPIPPPKALQHQQQLPPARGHISIPVGHQSHPYPSVVDGIPMREDPLPFCGIGVGWALFLAGFFFAAIPWYVGVFILLFVIQDRREKPGLIACTVAAVLALIPIIFNAFNFHHWRRPLHI